MERETWVQMPAQLGLREPSKLHLLNNLFLNKVRITTLGLASIPAVLQVEFQAALGYRKGDQWVALLSARHPQPTPEQTGSHYVSAYCAGTQ